MDIVELATREEMKSKAVEIMRELHISKNVVEEFKHHDKLNESEGIGALYWLNEEEQQMVKEFEEESGHVVYHVIHSFTNYGEMYSMLFVSKYKEDWQVTCDKFDGGQYRVYSYVYNKTDPWMSDMGSILVRPSIGGLIRTA